MKKIYTSPDLQIVNFTLKDVVLSSPIEGTIPVQDSPVVIGDESPDLDGFGD